MRPKLLMKSLNSEKIRCAALPPPSENPEDLFRQSLDLIKRIVEHTCRRFRLRPEDKDDFLSRTHIKLMEDDYAVIRRFEGRDNAKFDTYLTIVVKRFLLDYLDHLWGKWRESAEAHRLGEVAERLEQLINRDGYTFDEACEVLRTDQKIGLSVAQLADFWAKLPPRVTRQIVGEEPLRFELARELPPDQQLQEKQMAVKKRRICIALHRALDTLPPDDRLLIKLTSSFKVSDIARILKVEQKPLYRRIAKVLKALQRAMECQGVRREDVQEILGSLTECRDANSKTTESRRPPMLVEQGT